MAWWLVAILAWTLIAIAVGLLVGAMTAMADCRERAQRRVPEPASERRSLALRSSTRSKGRHCPWRKAGVDVLDSQTAAPSPARRETAASSPHSRLHRRDRARDRR